ncbi:MAG: AI-2E family transporter [Rhodothermales bacterium]|nr:AI-2E family transporter [Rhodothermales bacterium]
MEPTPLLFRRTFLLLLVIGITLLFLRMIDQYLITLLMAAIFTAMAHPLYVWMLRRVGGRRTPASLLTILIVLLLLVIPITAFLGIVAAEAANILTTIRPGIEQLLQQPNVIRDWVDRLPFAEYIEPYESEILVRLGDAVQRMGDFVILNIATVTTGTAIFFLHIGIMLYAMFFFLIDGKSLLDQILHYIPMRDGDKRLLVEKFVSVTRASLWGALLIGIMQGGLAGVAFAVAGIGGAVFWGTVMAVMSIIPLLGAAIVWIPGVIYLIATGKIGAGIGLAVWCMIVVGLADNLARPRLVGKDIQMPDLLVLLGIIGGLSLFGGIGLFIGPIIAALFVAVWDLYGRAFSSMLEKQPATATPAQNVSTTASSYGDTPPAT